VALVLELLGETGALYRLLLDHLLHGLGDFDLSHLHVLDLFLLLHFFSLGAELVRIRILLLLDQLVEHSAVIEQLGRRFVHSGERCRNLLPRLHELICVQFVEG